MVCRGHDDLKTTGQLGPRIPSWEIQFTQGTRQFRHKLQDKISETLAAQHSGTHHRVELNLPRDIQTEAAKIAGFRCFICHRMGDTVGACPRPVLPDELQRGRARIVTANDARIASPPNTNTHAGHRLGCCGGPSRLHSERTTLRSKGRTGKILHAQALCKPHHAFGVPQIIFCGPPVRAVWGLS